MSGVDPELLARLLRQRRELGAPPLFLEDHDRDDLLAAGRSLLSGRTHGAGAAGRSGPAAGVGAGPARERGPALPLTDDADLAVALQGDYETLRRAANGCVRCRLSESRENVVFSDGPPDARVMVVGEAPGANEDRTGLPFVGAAGQLLDLMLASVDLSRERDVYICNVLKCRPPGNRNPKPDEIECCAPFLRRQAELVSPEVVLAVGTFSAQWLTGTSTALGRLRGSVHSYGGVPVVVTYHPAALLRNPGWTRATWDDLQLLRDVLADR